IASLPPPSLAVRSGRRRPSPSVGPHSATGAGRGRLRAGSLGGVTEQTPPAVDGTKAGLAKTMLLYTGLRLAMFAVIAAAIYYGVSAVVGEFPLLLAALFALIISLPLSMIVLTDLRKKLNRQIAAV